MERQRQVCQHQDVSVVTPPALCTWVSSPTGIFDCFKVLNWRTHHYRHTLARTYTLKCTARERVKGRNRELLCKLRLRLKKDRQRGGGQMEENRFVSCYPAALCKNI